MLPDPMDIVQEKPAVTVSAQNSTIPQSSLALQEVRPDVVLSIDPVCRGKYTNNQWYRRCNMVGFDAQFDDVAANIRCEHFYFSRFAFDTPDAFVSRRNASVLALSMARNNTRPISITQKPDFQNIQNDVKSPMFPWTQPIVESDMSRDIVTENRTIFEPSRAVTRSEAFSLLMASVCMYPKSASDINWQKNVYDVAHQNGLTTRTWSAFAPDQNITVRELAFLTTRVADWAEKTGGCSVKPVQCQ